MDKTAVIGMVIVVVIAIVGFMLYNYQVQQAARARAMDPGQQIAGGIGNLVGGIIGIAEGH